MNAVCIPAQIILNYIIGWKMKTSCGQGFYGVSKINEPFDGCQYKQCKCRKYIQSVPSPFTDSATIVQQDGIGSNLDGYCDCRHFTLSQARDVLQRFVNNGSGYCPVWHRVDPITDGSFG